MTPATFRSVARPSAAIATVAVAVASATLAVALAAACRPHAAHADPPPTTGPFAVRSDRALARDLARARSEARASNRAVLLAFVGEWCGDSQEVVRVMGRAPAAEVLRERYVVVFVEVGRWDRHAALRARHHVERLATLVVEGGPHDGARAVLEPTRPAAAPLTPERLASWLRSPAATAL